MSCSVASKQNQLKTAQTSNGKYPFGFRGSSNLIKMGPIQNNQKIMVHLLWGSTARATLFALDRCKPKARRLDLLLFQSDSTMIDLCLSPAVLIQSLGLLD